MAELKNIRPGPTTDFVARFNDGVDDIKDLREGMELEGTVKRGRVWCFLSTWACTRMDWHVSQLSHKFATDAREVVKTGDIVKVRDRSRRKRKTHRADRSWRDWPGATRQGTTVSRAPDQVDRAWPA
jgi:hypothetical protein